MSVIIKQSRSNSGMKKYNYDRAGSNKQKAVGRLSKVLVKGVK